MTSITKEVFGTLEHSDKVAHKYSLRNQNGLSLVCTNFGCTILAINAPDKDGNHENITISYQTLTDLQNPPGRPYFGAIIGRFANRIENGRFELEGKQYALNCNNGSCSLHGGRFLSVLILN
jgi:aldose 1-epimerase